MRIVLDLQACQSPESSKRGIGRYSLALAREMASCGSEHQIYVALSGTLGAEIERLRCAFDNVLPQSNIVVWEGLPNIAAVHPDNTFRRQASTLLRERFIASLRPDVVHVASLFEGLAEDIVSSVPSAESAAVNAVTLYDLIPLVNETDYLSDPTIRQWYYERVDNVKRAGLLLGISEFTRREGIELLGMPADRIVNISGAADDIFRVLDDAEVQRPRLAKRYGFQRRFIMYAGGFDPRKNIGALIRAFARLPEKIRKVYQLVIVGSPPAHERTQLEEVIQKEGLSASDVVFVGFVPDADLVKLYNLCHLYVFPSLHEGFGLPALEAMSCGAAVIGSNVTSLPEVIGYDDALFDPKRVDSISTKMLQALTDESFWHSLKQHARTQPAKFSWNRSAKRALEAFESAKRHPQDGLEIRLPSLQQRNASRLNRAVQASPEDDLPVVSGASNAYKSSSKAEESFPSMSVTAQPFTLEVRDANDSSCLADLLRGKPAEEGIRALLGSGAPGQGLLARLIYRTGGYASLLKVQREQWAPAAISQVLPTHVLDAASAFLVRSSGAARKNGAWDDDLLDDDPDFHFVRQVAALPNAALAAEKDLSQVASALARNRLVAMPGKQLLVDISTFVVHDAGTGIQRVVRNVLMQLLREPPEGMTVEPVYMDGDGVFRYARSFCATRYLEGMPLPEDAPVEYGYHDIFYGLDLTAHLVPQFRHTFDRMRQRGVAIYFLLHDLLPILRRDCFDPAIVPTFRAWYEVTSELADGIVCVSHAVARQYLDWLDSYRPARQRLLRVGVAYSGVEFADKAHADKDTEAWQTAAEKLSSRTTFLMVGTIEPRKGHAQALAAFECLWAQGFEVNLVIIGKQGWLVDVLADRLREHAEIGHRLFWFDAATDDFLVAMYRRADAYLMTSEGEGFGLPIIEASHYGKLLILRDIDVFREVAGDHASYFFGYGGDQLAAMLAQWIEQFESGRFQGSQNLAWHGWHESARQAMSLVVDGNWPYTWVLGRRYVFDAFDGRGQSPVGRFQRGEYHTSGIGGVLFRSSDTPVAAGRYELIAHMRWDHGGGSAWLTIISGRGDMNHFHAELVPSGIGTPLMLPLGEMTLSDDADDVELELRVDAAADLGFSRLELKPLEFPTA